MGMVSEIAIQSVVRNIATKITAEINRLKDEGETEDGTAIVALKTVGRMALEQFEWDTPAWAKPYETMFKQ